MSDAACAEYDVDSIGRHEGIRRLGARAFPSIAVLACAAILGLWMVRLRPIEAPRLTAPKIATQVRSPYGRLSISTAPRSNSVAASRLGPGPLAIRNTAAAGWRFAPNPYGALAEPRAAVSLQALALRSSLDLDLEVGPTNAVAAAPAPEPPLPPRRPSNFGVTPPPTPPAVASNAPTVAPPSAPGFFQRLFGDLHPAQGQVVAYAAPETTTISRSAPQSAVPRGAAPWGQGQPSGLARYDKFTAVYDIEAKTVYLPNGTRLEAHSGLGGLKDDPKFVKEHARGATPPDVYELSLREGSFHGVQALRMKPIGSGEQFGRTGLLAHPYMLGAEGDSFGCVSFKDYDAFLQAFQAGQVKKLAVVAKLD